MVTSGLATFWPFRSHMIEVFFQTPSASKGWPTASWMTTPEFLLPSTTGWSPGTG
jgi:hypothetical protein